VTLEEAYAGLARETGWTLDYIRSMSDYDRLLMFGYREKPSEAEIKDAQAALMRKFAGFAQLHKGGKHV
jgi:hypothetical protein